MFPSAQRALRSVTLLAGLVWWQGTVHGAVEQKKGFSICTLDPPEKGFFAKTLSFHGIPIKAPKEVAGEALIAAYERLSMMLSNQPAVISNLVTAGAELHIIGREQMTSDLPEHRHLKGKKLKEYHGLTVDERTR